MKPDTSHTEQVRGALAERLTGLPFIGSVTERQHYITRAAAGAARNTLLLAHSKQSERRFTGEANTGFGAL